MHALDAERTDAPTPEQSPSCGTFEIAEIYGCANAHAAEADTSDVDRLAAVTREGRPAEYREKHALEVSS